jgi:biotin carboxylase
MSHTFLVLGGGGPNGHAADWSRRIVAAARARGDRLHIADVPEHLVSVAADEAVLGTYPVDYRDVAGCLALARSLDPGDGSFAVVGFREFSQLSAATAARAVGSTWNPPEVVSRVRDKYACREWLRARGFRQPECHVFTGTAPAAAFLRGRRGRWVVKPRDAFGSEGVTAVEAPCDAAIPAAVEWASSFSPDVIVEEFVEGPEFSAEGIVLEGEPMLLGLTEKSTTPPPYFVEIGHVQPPVRTDFDEAAVGSTVLAAVRAVGLRHSLFHVELWWTDCGVVLGEVHGRGGGDWIHTLIGYRRPGLDVFAAVLDSTVGRAVHIPDAQPGRAAAVAALTAAGPGRVVAIEGVAETRDRPECLAVDILVEPGDEVGGGLVDSFSRVGMVVAAGDDPPGARRTVRQLAEGIRFRLAAAGARA